MTGEVKTTAWSELFSLLPAGVRAKVESQVRVLRAQRGRTIIAAGTRSTDVFVISEGKVQIVLYSSSGREVSVRDLEAGELFGELSAIDGRPRSASVVALTDVRLRLLSRADFLFGIESSAAAGIWLARRLGSEVRRLTERVFELSALNVQARLHCELLRLACLSGEGLVISPAPTHAELASRIGSHREAVTREIRMLAQLKIIRAGRRSLEFLDLDRLRQVVSRAVGDLVGA